MNWCSCLLKVAKLKQKKTKGLICQLECKVIGLIINFSLIIFNDGSPNDFLPNESSEYLRSYLVGMYTVHEITPEILNTVSN